MVGAMNKEVVQEVVIVGGGIAGLATAVGLQKMGVASLVLEKAPELRTAGSSITLAPNALRALEALGVAHKLFAVYHPFQTVHYTNIEDGSTQEVPFGRGALAVHRKFMQQILAEELPPNTIRFSSKIISIQTGEGDIGSPHQTATLLLDDGTSLKAKVLIGCDGVHSVVAQWLGLAPPMESGRSAVRGMSEFPEGHGFKNEVRQFLGYGMRGVILPLNQKDVFWSVVYSSEPKEKDLSRDDPELILKEVTEKLCKDFPPEYLDVVGRSDLSSLTRAPLLFRAPWNVAFGRVHRGCVTVAGDAMHPMTPDLGQGGCTALEDAVVLARNIRQASMSIEKGIESYVKERRRRAAEIITMSYLFGWAQQGSSNGGVAKLMKEWFRDKILYRFLFKHIRGIAEYDCGTLNPNQE